MFFIRIKYCTLSIRILRNKERKIVDHRGFMFAEPPTWCFPGITRSVNYSAICPCQPKFSLLTFISVTIWSLDIFYIFIFLISKRIRFTGGASDELRKNALNLKRFSLCICVCVKPFTTDHELQCIIVFTRVSGNIPVWSVVWWKYIEPLLELVVLTGEQLGISTNQETKKILDVLNG